MSLEDINDEQNIDKRRHVFNKAANAAKELNLLSGILKAIISDRLVSPEELDYLDLWLKDSHISQFGDGEDLLCHLEDLIGLDSLDDAQLEDTLTLFNDVSEAIAKDAARAKDFENQLLGLCKGSLSDGKLQNKEIQTIHEFLSSQEHLEAQEAKIAALLRNVLEDGVITDEERTDLQKALTELCGHTFQEDGSTSGAPRILDDSLFELPHDYPNLTFLLTGNFRTRSKKDVEEELVELGASVKTSVSKSIDVLVVGSSAHWKTETAGKKQLAAEEMRLNGHHIRIVSLGALESWLLQDVTKKATGKNS